jgi:hypothetical protein
MALQQDENRGNYESIDGAGYDASEYDEGYTEEEHEAANDALEDWTEAAADADAADADAASA